MRVALFFDGKNFYSGWREATKGRRIDFTKLANWLVAKSSGTSLWGAYYFTGVEDPALGQPSEVQQKLVGFLDMLETQPGFFVNTFRRKISSMICGECGSESKHSHDKEVDIALVSKMTQMAANDSFDAMVLLSGDADYAPAVETVRSLGKQVYIASWGGTGVSKKIRSAAFDHIDMLEGMPVFEREDIYLELDDFSDGNMPDEADAPVDIAPVTGDNSMDAFISELHQAETKFNGGYVGLGYFLTRWRSPFLDSTPDIRRHVLDKLLADGLVETYNAPDGALAIRVSNSAANALMEHTVN